jgi:DNA-directed RNA polymerase subunit RPC12/RpoP
MTDTPNATKSTREFPCSGCGANMSFAPGTRTLKCTHCGMENVIPDDGAPIAENDYLDELDRLQGQADNFDTLEVQCANCAAMTTLPDATVAMECPFCGTGIVATAKSQRLIKPAALLPFAITRAQALGYFDKWLHSLWFAPSDLKKRAITESRFAGIYLPYWVYDTKADTRYTGERGDDYYTTESYTDSKGKRQTRSVKRTRWRSVSGSINSTFIDVLVCASVSLPNDLIAPLEPWDLRSQTPYRDEYLSGFRAEAYKIPLKQGFEHAKEIIAPEIDRQIRSDIGGDHQRIHSKRSSYFNIRFQHILLPVWVSSFTYAGTLYQFLVNARTGEVQGKRPYSAWKIAFAVIAGLILAATLLGILASLKH